MTLVPTRPADHPKRVVSFSLWGCDQLYVQGAIENAHLVRRIYPGWVARFYCAADVAPAVRAALHSAGAEVVDVAAPPATARWVGLFWRFLPIDDPTVDRMISRDADSRLNVREAACVRHWERSGRPFHVMRDNPVHFAPILGGMFGCRAGLVNMASLIASWKHFDHKNCDQEFLSAMVWPVVRADHLAHDEIHKYSGRLAEPFPKHAPMQHGTFVGETIQV